MFYVIIGVLILLFYTFVAPESIKGTLNIVTLVVGMVAVLILLVLGIFQIFQLPLEIFVTIFMIALAYFALADIAKISQKEKKLSLLSKFRNR